MDLIGVKSEFVKDHIDKLLKSGRSDYKTKADISRALGVKPQYLTMLLNGQRNISDKFFKKFTTIFDVNQNDLDFIKTQELQFLEKIQNSKTEITHECKLCAEKDKLIKEKENRIQELKEMISLLKGDCQGKRNSA